MRNLDANTVSPMLAIGARFEDFDEFNELVGEWDLDYRQLKRGPSATELKQLVSPAWTVGRVRTNRSAFQQGSAPPGMRSFALLGAAAAESDWCGGSFRPDTVAIFARDRDFRCVSPAGFDVYALSFTEFELARASRRLGLPDISDDLKPHDEIRMVDPVKVITLRRLADEALAKYCSVGMSLLPVDRAQESARERICDQLVLVLVSAEPTRQRPSWRKLTATTSKTLDYIEEHLADGITVRDVADATQTSRRTLENAFRSQFDMSPKSFINEQRLILVRRELLRVTPGQKVSDAANAWGYWHMGQFARDYRKLFSELPSETLRRAGN